MADGLICVGCPNPALDVTYRVSSLSPGASHRVDEVHHSPGGKGVNVARVLALLGTPARLVAPLGGRHGDVLVASLAAGGVDLVATPIAGETRQTVTVVAEDAATVFNEPGPSLSGTEWRRFADALTAAAADARVAVLAGSLPPHVSASDVAALTRRLAAGSTLVVDSSGAGLVAALDGGPQVVKVNESELADLLGTRLASPSLVIEAIRGLRETHDLDAAIVSRGAAGVVAITRNGAWSSSPPRHVLGNPTGAGDALTAAVTRGIAAGHDWPRVLTDAIALSAAAVAAPAAGTLDPALAAKLRDEVKVEDLSEVDA